MHLNHKTVWYRDNLSKITHADVMRHCGAADQQLILAINHTIYPDFAAHIIKKRVINAYVA